MSFTTRMTYLSLSGFARHCCSFTSRNITGASVLHRTKFQESVNGNVIETCETDPETRRITCVSVSGFVTFTHVSVAAYTAERDHFLAFLFRKRDRIT